MDMDSGKHGTVREMNALLDQLARQTEFVDVEDRSAPTKASLCARALVAGCPDAFINFHYLPTTGDGVGDDNPTEEELLARLVDPDAYEEKEEVSAEPAVVLDPSSPPRRTRGATTPQRRGTPTAPSRASSSTPIIP